MKTPNNEGSKNTRVIDEADIRFIASNLREKMLSEDSDLKALQDSGLINEKAARTLLSMKNGIEGDYRKTERYERIVESQISRNIRESVENNNITALSHALGIVSRNRNLTSFQRIKKLRRLVSVKGRTFQFAGDPDTGKTNLAAFCTELWLDSTGGKVITNMDSFDKGMTVKKFSELKEASEKYDRWLFIMEDASNHISGYQVDRAFVEEELRPFKNELAKLGGNMMLLGHTGSDIHPDLRRNAFQFWKKSKKTVEVWTTDRKGNKDEKIQQYSNIPKASIGYDPAETTSFSFDTAEEEDTELDERMKKKKAIIDMIKQLFENQTVVKTVEVAGHSNADVAEVMRELAKENDSLRFFDNKSPKRLKARVI